MCSITRHQIKTLWCSSNAGLFHDLHPCDENVYIENSSPCLSVHRKMTRGTQEPQHTAGLYSGVFHSLCTGTKFCFVKVLGYRQEQRLPPGGGQLLALSKVWVPTSQLGHWGPSDMGRMARAMGGSKWTHMYLCAHACIHIWPFQTCNPSPLSG